MLNPEHLLRLVVRPVLQRLAQVNPRYNSVAAEQLIMGTIAKESGFRSLEQLAHRDGRQGPALGLGQMEPATYADNWRNYLGYPAKRELMNAVLEFSITTGLYRLNMPTGKSVMMPTPVQLVANLFLVVAMIRVHYLRITAPLPEAGYVDGMAHYWNDNYNRNPDAGTPEEFIEAWEACGLSELWD